MGTYECPRTPEEPMVLQLTRTPLSPGLPIPDQWKAGRWDLLTTSVETFEREIRDQLVGCSRAAASIRRAISRRSPSTDGRTATPGGFDPDSGDIYWTTEEWPKEKRTWERARATFGRIAIANSDSGANAMTEEAIARRTGPFTSCCRPSRVSAASGCRTSDVQTASGAA